MNDYQKFKHLLEYFIAHLEYVVNNDKNGIGYDTYLKHWVDSNNFYKQGQGYNGANIQKQIEKWDSYSNGHRIAINIYGASKTPYRNNACYLNWKGTWVNVRPVWKNNHIIELYLSKEEHSGAKPVETKTIKELGLFDNNEPNDILHNFLDEYRKILDNYNSKQNEQIMKEQIQTYTDLLRTTHNLILTGAPGTGKTYLAHQIAKEMGAEVGFVQFHPSYDYTDFVEGLRPIQDDNGNVGFERKDGVFKAFCKKAISVPKNDTIDNFNETWDKLVATLNENNFIDVPFLSNKSKSFRVELNEYGTGLTNRTYPNDTYEQGGWISGQSKFFSKDQLYNIYKGLSGVPSGGHDNYRRAIVEEMKNSLGLKPYKEGHSETKPKKPFVFIIDEINRGEISKIFGELFFSIDPGYRGEKGRVQTQYQNIVEDGDIFKKGFFVPENVYIIGTMNDIDRSVESMDFAFRRRFAFKEIKAEENTGMLKDLGELKDKAINRMKNLNSAIEKVDGLSSAYHIGASYFLKLANYKKDDEKDEFGKLWEYHLEGLLREYLRGTQDVDKEIEKLKTAYNDESDNNNGQLPQQVN